MTIQKVADKFVAAINRQDVAAIYKLMTEDHRFIDSGGQIFEGRERMKAAWPDYFKMFPDYSIEVSEKFASADTIVLLGHASGTYTSDGSLKPENHWHIPAAWKAVIAGEKVKLWQVFADNEPIGEIIRSDKALLNQ